MSDNRIIVTGFIPDADLVKLYSSAKLFAYVSYFEGFGIPPLEAMAMGCPTMVSNTTSMPEICGDASYYVNPYDIDSIRIGLEKLSHDDSLRERLIASGYNQIQKYRWDKTGIDVLKVINKIERD